MKKTKFISKTLYVVTSLLAFLYFVTTAYAIGCKTLGINIHYTQKQEVIEYPFTDIPFLLLHDTWRYWIFSFLIPLLFYTLFFFFLSNVFKVFFQPRIFTKSNIIHLKRFYWHNLFASIILMFIAYLFVELETPVFIIVSLHIFLGIFVFILSEIFNQGLHLQNEQDLYI
ncbi:DUF2975 domain-containing protein [Aquimarina hainanensis]|uniref:DUF2975 domain-containing protein n=1 Tax=Aquimarina hainanensis TaxID=1578017 RepID=A0ABW5N3Q1_9FLAO